MRNDDDILNKFSNRNCFKVPEGYFDKLPLSVMDKLPDNKVCKEKSILRGYLSPILYAAASVIIAIFCLTTFFDNTTEIDNVTTEVAQSNGDAYSDAIVDYAMMDNLDIYSCLASEYNN